MSENQVRENEVRDDAVKERFLQALDRLVVKLKQDPYVLAAILLGSLSHDVVWEKSDIDLLVITQEVKRKASGYGLVEDGINIHAYLNTRSEFQKRLEGSLHSSFMHSLYSKGTLLYSHDRTIEEMFAGRHHFGARDREIQLLNAAAGVLPALMKAEKWLSVKHDVEYCFVWILACLNGLASLETIAHGEITGREVIHQALRYNPDFFHAVYTDLIHAEKTEAVLEQALVRIQGYLKERIPLLFKPLLDYLAEAGTARSLTEISYYFEKERNIAFIDAACEWLADENILQKVSTPVRLTEKSRVDVEEAAYYYEAEEQR